MSIHSGQAAERGRLGVGRRWRGLAGLILVISLLTSTGRVHAATDWDTALDTINGLYSNYSALQATLKNDSSKLQQLRKQNTAAQTSVKTRLQAVDRAVLDRLQNEADTIRKKHAPLLDQYTTLGKQAAAARKAKDLKTAALLDLKRNRLKASATAARAAVKVKADALAAARKQTAARIKPVKDALATVSELKKQIASSNKTLSTAQKARSEADKGYNAAVKQGNAIAAAAEMKTSYSQMASIQALQQTLYTLEQKVAQALRTAELKLPN